MKKIIRILCVTYILTHNTAVPKSINKAKQQLVIFAQITPKPEFFDDAKNAILNIIPQSLAEAGCRMFSLHTSKTMEDHSLYLYEIWDDASDHEYHLNQEYTKTVFAAYQVWLEKPVQIIKLDKIS